MLFEVQDLQFQTLVLVIFHKVILYVSIYSWIFFAIFCENTYTLFAASKAQVCWFDAPSVEITFQVDYIIFRRVFLVSDRKAENQHTFLP